MRKKRHERNQVQRGEFRMRRAIAGGVDSVKRGRNEEPPVNAGGCISHPWRIEAGSCCRTVWRKVVVGLASVRQGIFLPQPSTEIDELAPLAAEGELRPIRHGYQILPLLADGAGYRQHRLNYRIIFTQFLLPYLSPPPDLPPLSPPLLELPDSALAADLYDSLR